MTSLAGMIIDVASSCTVSRSGISIVSSARAGAAASRVALLLALALFFEQQFLSRDLSLPPPCPRDCERDRRDARRSTGAGARRSAAPPGRPGPGRAPGVSGTERTVAGRATRRAASAEARRSHAACRRSGTLVRAEPHPGRGATPGRPGDRFAVQARRMRRSVGGGAGRLMTDCWPAARGAAAGPARRGSQDGGRGGGWGGRRRRACRRRAGAAGSNCGRRQVSRLGAVRVATGLQALDRRRGRLGLCGAQASPSPEAAGAAAFAAGAFGGDRSVFQAEHAANQIGDLIRDDAQLIFCFEDAAQSLVEERGQLLRGEPDLFGELENPYFSGQVSSRTTFRVPSVSARSPNRRLGSAR